MFQTREPEFTFDRARWRRDARRKGMVREYLEQRCRAGIDPDAHLDADAGLEPGPESGSESGSESGPGPHPGHD